MNDSGGELLTAAQMRAVERAAIDGGLVTGLELMERAGRAVVAAVLAEWPATAVAPGRAVVLCGPGNNGGDGFVVARLLKDRGWEVALFLYGDAEKLPPDARANCERWCAMGEVRPWSLPELFDRVGTGGVLVVDALFGTGLTRPLDGALCDLAVALERGPDASIVAVDAPSGLCLDSGRPLAGADGRAGCIRCHLCVTFHRAKPGHYLDHGPASIGRLVVADIGLRDEAGSDSGARRPARLVRPLGRRLAKGGGHKYDFGHAVVLSGPATRTGAARMAARGALRIGAGLVTIAAPRDALAEHAARLDAIMLRRVDGADELRGLLQDDRLNALCLGPGLGVERAAELLPVVLAPADPAAGSRPARRVVIDADALTALAGDSGLFARLHRGCVLTPHAGEFRRLFPDIAATLAEPATRGPACSKIDATRAAAARAGCTVVFKGADTVIADPDGRCELNAAAYDREAPWLATAGSGDTLAGMICGLLARGFDPMDAAATAAWLHVDCARSFGPGLIAEDLPEELPKVLRRLMG